MNYVETYDGVTGQTVDIKIAKIVFRYPVATTATPLTFLMYGQICVLVVVAILEKVAWHSQICNSCFYPVNKLWPIGLLFFYYWCCNRLYL